MANACQRFSYGGTGLAKLFADLKKCISVSSALEGSTAVSAGEPSLPPKAIWEHLCNYESHECTNILEEKNLEDFPDWLYFRGH